jgi:hypothetical protein
LSPPNVHPCTQQSGLPPGHRNRNAAWQSVRMPVSLPGQMHLPKQLLLQADATLCSTVSSESEAMRPKSVGYAAALLSRGSHAHGASLTAADCSASRWTAAIW